MDTGMMSLLLEHGLSIDSTNSRRRTLLHEATRDGIEVTVTWLLGMGIDINADDRGGATALCHAARLRKVTNVKTLLEQGADIIAMDAWGLKSLLDCADCDIYEETSDLIKNAIIE